MRRAIARRIQAHKQEIPHSRAHIDVELDRLLTLREESNTHEWWEEVSVEGLIIKAVANALGRHPPLSVHFDGAATRTLASCDISVTLAAGDGVLTPIVFDAANKDARAISAELRDLSARAEARELKPSELVGGTFTVTNLGMYGVQSFDAVISPPQVAVLAVGAATQQPVVAGGEIVCATVMRLTLCSDQRVVNGVNAARFLSDLRAILEDPDAELG